MPDHNMKRDYQSLCISYCNKRDNNDNDKSGFIYRLIRNTISEYFTAIDIIPFMGVSHPQCAPYPLPGEYSYHMVTLRPYGNYYRNRFRILPVPNFSPWYGMANIH